MGSVRAIEKSQNQRTSSPKTEEARNTPRSDLINIE
jgi:hypothetical protein